MRNQKPQSLCNLPQLAPGAHRSVRIAAIAESGTDMGVLTDASCPSVQAAWFELSLKSERNRNKLHNQLEKSGKAVVVLDITLPYYVPRWGNWPMDDDLRNVDEALGNWLDRELQEPPGFGGKPGEPVPAVDPEDVKTVWQIGREAQGNHAGEHVAIGVDLMKHACKPGADIEAISYRAGLAHQLS